MSEKRTLAHTPFISYSQSTNTLRCLPYPKHWTSWERRKRSVTHAFSPLEGLRYHWEETTCIGHLEKDANLCTVRVDLDESLWVLWFSIFLPGFFFSNRGPWPSECRDASCVILSLIRRDKPHNYLNRESMNKLVGHGCAFQLMLDTWRDHGSTGCMVGRSSEGAA